MESALTSDVDTISNLPRDVLEEILGCLPLKDAVKTGILSKDWRYKWVTRAELDFDGEFFEDNQEAKTIIYQILLLHKGRILKFKLQGPNVMSCPDINHWLLFLSKKNIQEFTLHICSGNEYRIPSHLFTLKQLRHLELVLCLFHPPPSFKGFEKLINLDLESVIFDPAIFRNLISKCPLLERLRLNWCTDFEIFEIDAPNLKWFDFIGNFKSICFKNAPMLWSISVWLDSQVLMDPSTFCSNLIKFFHYMPSLQELELSSSTLEYLTIGGLPESPPTSLNNVKHLRILNMSFGNAAEISCAVYLITCCPKLQDLTMECETVDIVVEPVMQFLRAQSNSSGVVKLLQSVEMCYFTGFKMEMEFMKFILASAPVLEEIFIWNIAQNFHRSTYESMEEMRQLFRLSPNVNFLYQEAFTDSELP